MFTSSLSCCVLPLCIYGWASWQNCHTFLWFHRSSSWICLNSHWFNIQFLVPTAFQGHKILANRWHLVTHIWQWIFQSRGPPSLHWMRKLTKPHLNSWDTHHSQTLSGLTQQAHLIHFWVLVQPVPHSGSLAHLFYSVLLPHLLEAVERSLVLGILLG